ncbi:MAG: cytochrome o ubiquinol oxidase subunit IV [Rhizobiales bacterium]|nr:cytochrome o ubiquinol oxidase subunit IV [Hyphomicrobiales bacterium]MBN9009683.1 cytochrome o ubiquinol oxidase subunit IV [Hyphomicrobiales bacterium]
MSATPHPDPHAADAASHGGDGAGHATLRGYLTGFVLAAILTAIPFALVMTGAIPDRQATAIIVMGFAVVQIFVHMIYFLHMDARTEHGWSLMALIFTIVMVVIALAGSLWVMYHLNANMMPGMPDMSQLP